ncbi:MAG: cytochrome P450 [Beijerinckiaceae bacterium]|jgi:cytochrome P450
MTKGLNLDEPGPDIFYSQRKSWASAVAIVRDPLASLPPQVFRHSLVASRIFGRSRLFVCDPALVHEALVRNADALGKGEENRRVLGPALGNGLLTADGPSWKWQRQTLAPAFQIDKLREFLPAMIAAAEETRDGWLAKGPGGVVSLGHDLMTTTFKIIVETMLSGLGQIDAAAVRRGVSDYLKPANWMGLLSVLKAPRWVPYPGRRRAMNAAVQMRSAVQTMVAARRRAGTPQQDLVSLLLSASDPETGRSMSDAEIADNLLTFITAGHETTALALGWTLALLAAHPAIEAKAVEEIEAVTGGGAVKPEHIDQLTYVRQVFNESMRLYPPAPLIFRAVLSDFDLAGHAVKAGTVVVIPIYALHRHVKFWEDPEKFDPGRFAPAEVKTRHRYAFMPFGAGHRICIGSAFATMEAVAILAVLLKSVRLQPVGDALPAPKLRITLRPAKEIEMRVSPRHAQGAPTGL